jgi:hypothetical protein
MTKCSATVLIGLLLAGASAGAAQAAVGPAGCSLHIEAAKTSWTIQGYDPFGTATPVDEFDVTLVNNGAGECRVRTSADLSTEPFGLDQGASARVVYALIDLGDNRDITPRTGMTLPDPTRPFVVIDAGSQKIVRFRFVVDPAKLAGDGLLTQNALIAALDDGGSTIASKQVVLGLDVKPAAMVGLAGSFRLNGGRAMVDLGHLEEGITPILLSLYVQSTRPYTINLDSANSGNLKLGSTEWSVPYQILLGDKTLPLSGSAQYLAPQGTALARQSLPLNFAIGSTANLRAGRYSDVVTVSIAPQ